MSALQTLHWRYATQKFDSSRRINAAEWRVLKESLRLSPSSYDLQPWKFVEVRGTVLRQRLAKACYNQPQIGSADRLLVITGKRSLRLADINALMQAIAAQRHKPRASLAGFERVIRRDVSSMTPAERREWNARQAYIALGFLLYVAAEMRIDACPIEGFDAKVVNRLLKLKPLGVEPLVVVALGYRDANDPHAKDKKVRFAAKDVFITR